MHLSPKENMALPVSLTNLILYGLNNNEILFKIKQTSKGYYMKSLETVMRQLSDLYDFNQKLRTYKITESNTIKEASEIVCPTTLPAPLVVNASPPRSQAKSVKVTP